MLWSWHHWISSPSMKIKKKILGDAICTEPVDCSESLYGSELTKKNKYEKYKVKDYKPSPHEYIDSNGDER